MIAFSVGVTFATHRCEGMVMHTAVNDVVDSCHTFEEAKHTCPHQKSNDDEECCESSIELAALNEQDVLVADFVQAPMAVFFIAYEINIDLVREKHSKYIHHFVPPLINRDLIPFIQSFLI